MTQLKSMILGSIALILICTGFAACKSNAGGMNSPAQAAVQPSTKGEMPTRIFFARKGKGNKGWSIYSVDADGGDERLEVPFKSGMGEYNPAVSPDGRTLMFNSYRWGGWQLATMPLGGGGVTKWSDGANYYTNAVYSPDGSKVLYEVNARSGNHVLLNSAAGGAPLELTARFKKGENRVPAWTPDGKAAIFFSDQSGKNQLYRVPVHGGNPVLLSDGKGNDFAPAVSPDGTKIAFYSDRTGHADCFMANIDGSNPVNLTADLHNDETKYSYSGRTFWVLKCSWSPHSEGLVFTSAQAGNLDLYRVAADGTQRRRLTTTPNSEMTPFWGVAHYP